MIFFDLLASSAIMGQAARSAASSQLRRLRHCRHNMIIARQEEHSKESY
jgi:hypothetical protein